MRLITASTPRTFVEPRLATSGRAISMARSTQVDVVSMESAATDAPAGAAVSAAVARAEAPRAAVSPRLRVDAMEPSTFRYAVPRHGHPR